MASPSPSAHVGNAARLVLALTAVVAWTAIPGTAAERWVLAEEFTATW
jgi:hypothetical protein